MIYPRLDGPASLGVSWHAFSVPSVFSCILRLLYVLDVRLDTRLEGDSPLGAGKAAPELRGRGICKVLCTST